VSELTVKLRKRHKNQEHIVKTAKRFNVLKCGRRFGKTSLAEELVIEPALDGFPVAYYAPTYKDLEEFWTVVKGILHDVIKSKSEQLKQIRLITGGVIDMWSMDDPDSGRGRKYKRVVIDECEKAKHLKVAWNGTIRATLTDFVGDAWFLSTPQFGQTYFKELFARAIDEKFEHEWQSWKFSTYDNPFMNHTEIESAKATTDPLYFLCEYMAEDVSIGSMLWAYAYDPNKHLCEFELDNGKETILSFDFNRNPMTCSVLQTDHYDSIDIYETIKLPNSDIYQMCEYIRTLYGNRLLVVTGDASGNSGSAMVQDNLNYYKIIASELNLNIRHFQVPTINPSIAKNRVLVNSLLSRGNVRLNKDKTKPLQFDLENVSVLADGTMKKQDRTDPAQQADALDTFRYACNVFLNKFVDM
jgi:hypothetical protein